MTNDKTGRLTTGELVKIAAELRYTVLEMSNRAQTSHLGGALSCMDLLTVLYWGGCLRLEPEQWGSAARDRVIFSKGYAISALIPEPGT